MGQFNGNNFNLPVANGNCGVGNLPVYGTINTEISCNNGISASTVQTPAATLSIGLQPNVASFKIGSSSAIRYVLFGSRFGETCLARIAADAGIPNIVFAGDVSTMNSGAANLNCIWDMGVVTASNVIARSATLDSLDGYQVAITACAPCITASTEFACGGGCGNGSTFALANAVAGSVYAFIITVPANVSDLKVDVCACSQELPSMASCPTGQASIAQIPAIPGCPPAYATNSSFVPGNTRTF